VHLSAPYTAKTLVAKQQSKRAVLDVFGLSVDEASLARSLAGIVSRLVDQKGFAHTINDLTKQTGVSMPLVYQVGETQLYPYGQVFSSGVWLLGLWQSGGECEYYVGKGCSSYTVEGVMTMVGTSM
jgi:hypothetical protein